MKMSRTRHAGPTGRGCLRNRAGEENVFAEYPAARSSRATPRRTERSSSTTNTVPPSLTSDMLRTSVVSRDCNPKCKTHSRITRRPHSAAMSLDDRAADGESHAQPIALGRKERLEHGRQALVIDRRAGVPYGEDPFVRRNDRADV